MNPAQPLFPGHVRVEVVNAFVLPSGKKAPGYSGNPAAVIQVDAWPSDAEMLAVAVQMNLSETAFVRPLADGRWHIRWFSPVCEIPFCGHAMLASAHVLHAMDGHALPLTFFAQEVGDVAVRSSGEGWLQMDFPDRSPQPVPAGDVPVALLEGLGEPPDEVWRSPQAWFAVYGSEQAVRGLSPDFARLRRLHPWDVVATAPGVTEDFVSRYFWPASGGDEDPVTGSIHAGLAPFWARRLGRHALVARQCSAREGWLRCEVDDPAASGGRQPGRVRVAGTCQPVLTGTLRWPA
jgi:PhzF family phenazine biosynthesis protein